MALTKERKGEIALAFLKYVISKDGLWLRPGQTIKEIKQKAKELDIPEDEAIEFCEEVIREIVDKAFPKE